VEKGTCVVNIQKSWPLKGIMPTITSTPLYQTRQGVLYDGLQILLFDVVDMHRLHPMIGEVMEFQRRLSVKRNLEKSLV
jgi:hypothetical protein